MGIVGLVRSSKPSKINPKILVFDSNVGIPTTEEVFRSVNEISKENVTDAATPDPWKEEVSEVENMTEKVRDSSEGTQLDEDEGDWQTWDEG